MGPNRGNEWKFLVDLIGKTCCRPALGWQGEPDKASSAATRTIAVSDRVPEGTGDRHRGLTEGPARLNLHQPFTALRRERLKMDAKTLGERIRELRLDHDLSLRQLAIRVDKSAPFISDVELGRRFPSPGVLEAIARELEVDPEELRKYDFRESMSALKHLSRTNPRWGVAFRTTADQIRKGDLTPEQLVEKLTGGDSS